LCGEDDPNKLLWWWCDALFMSPPVLLRMYAITNDRKYLDYMDHEWWLTSGSLYSPQEHLYFRDNRYFTQKQENGKPIFLVARQWLGDGCARECAADYAGGLSYAAEVCGAVSGDGGEAGGDSESGWIVAVGLLDPESYELRRCRGRRSLHLRWRMGSMRRFSIARLIFRWWRGRGREYFGHIYADGRLGSIQPIDAQPGKFKLSASYVYGVGGFLMAGSEMHRLAATKALGGIGWQRQVAPMRQQPDFRESWSCRSGCLDWLVRRGCQVLVTYLQ